MINLWLFIAGISIAGPSVVEDAAHVVVCSADQGCQAASVSRLLRADKFDHAWTWNATCAPQRALAKDVPTVIARIEKNHCSETALTTFAILGRLSKEPAYLRVAPAEMWKEADETLLPTLTLPQDESVIRARVPRGQTWRARALTNTRGSWWCDGRAGVGSRLYLFPSPVRLITVTDGRDRVRGAQASIIQGTAGRRRAEVLGVVRANEKGELTFAHVPPTESISIVVSASGYAPAVAKGLPGELPPEIRLKKGHTLQGRLVQSVKPNQTTPIADGEIHFEAWLDGSPVLFHQSVTTSPDGRFAFKSLPTGRGVMTARHGGLGSEKKEVELLDSDLDLGDVLLVREFAVAVRVRDDAGSFVASATVSHDGVKAATNARGEASIHGLRENEAATLTLSAPGYLSKTVRVNAPLPRILETDLGRAFVLTGRFVKKDGTPAEGDLMIHAGNTDTAHALEADGRFSLSLPPRSSVGLALNSPQAAPHREQLTTGWAGDSRDLGSIVVDDGISARGTVLARVDGTPVPGARVWAPRTTAEGPLVAWMRGEILETRTDADGRFVLRGLLSRTASLRIEAIGYARAYAVGVSNLSEGDFDVGIVFVGPGATVQVQGAGDVARLDLWGDALDFDMMNEPIVPSGTTFRHVPQGSVRLQIMRGRTIVCEKQVDVGSDGSELTVECSARSVHVTGVAMSGRLPVREGMLIWSSPGSDLHGAIMTRKSPAGLLQQDTYGNTSSVVAVAINDDGSFESDELRPGAWSVTWSGSGAAGVPKEVRIPDATSYHTILDYPATTLRGEVFDREGHQAAAAVVKEQRTGGATAMTDEQGRFAIAGISAGAHAFKATRSGDHSEIVTVEIDPSRESRPVIELRLGARSEVISVTVTSGGAPLPNSFVIAQNDHGTSNIITTSADGKAELPRDSASAHARFAVYSSRGWSFGGWKSWDEIAEGVTIDLSGQVGSLLITSRDRASSLPIVLDSQAWDVTSVLREVGLFGRFPLEIRGLPPGRYTIDWLGRQQIATVSKGECTEVVLH